MQTIQSNLLNRFPNVTHCFTTKEIGNLAFHVNDNPKNVLKNHDSLASLLDYNKNSLIHMKQIHSNDIHIVTDEDNFSNPKECDALITNKKNTPLMVMVADCSPILFYDNTKKAIGVAHAGRQGAFNNIVKNTVDALKENFDSDPKEICVSIGASIGICCYEVGDEIYDEAKKLELEYAFEKKNNRYHLSVSQILKTQLLAAGILEKHIEISNECTCCGGEKYFSYRADKYSGRFAGLISL